MYWFLPKVSCDAKKFFRISHGSPHFPELSPCIVLMQHSFRPLEEQRFPASSFHLMHISSLPSYYAEDQCFTQFNLELADRQWMKTSNR